MMPRARLTVKGRFRAEAEVPSKNKSEVARDAEGASLGHRISDRRLERPTGSSESHACRAQTNHLAWIGSYVEHMNSARFRDCLRVPGRPMALGG